MTVPSPRRWLRLGGGIEISHQGMTALAYASDWGRDHFVETLVVVGEDPNRICGSEGSEGLMPLHLAAGSQHSGTVDLLLVAGADVDAVSASDGHSAIWMCPNATITKRLLGS